MTTPTHTHTHTHLNELYWPSEEEEEAKFHLERVNSIVMMEFSHIFLSLFIKAIKLAPLPSQNAFCSYYLSYTFFGHPSSILASAQSSIVCVSVPLESGCECVCGGRGEGAPEWVCERANKLSHGWRWRYAAALFCSIIFRCLTCG